MRIAIVNATDYNGVTFDGTPITMVEGSDGDWIQTAMDARRLDPVSDGDYASWVVNLNGREYAHAFVGDLIIADDNDPPRLTVHRPLQKTDCFEVGTDTSRHRELLECFLGDDLSLISNQELLSGSVLLTQAMGLTEHHLETLNQCYVSGPVFDGDLISKHYRNALEDIGAITRTYVEGESGYNVCTPKGADIRNILIKRFPETVATDKDD